MSKIALITGGTRGIGKAISCALDAEGFKVIAIYHGNETEAKKLSETTGILTRKWDVADAEACRKGLEDVTETLGMPQVLVNNAGITRDCLLHKMTLPLWEDVLRTNLFSLFHMTQPLVDGMKATGWGRIINISSINALKGQRGQTNYCAAKAGVIGFTKALAQEVATSGITVNAIAPGYMDTEMVRAVPEAIVQTITSQIPMKHLGQPDDIAHMVCFLASDKADYITGATIHLNGGLYMA